MKQKQVKVAQDRVALLMSYEQMCKVFRVPRRKRITPSQFAAMPNAQILQACRDLYNGVSIRLAKKFERSIEPKQPFNLVLVVNRMLARAWLTWFHLKRRLHA